MRYDEARSIGDAGERRVTDALAAEAPSLGYKLTNNLLLIDDRTTAQLDHLIVDRFGILVVETKNYHALIKGASADKFWTACYSGSKKKRERFLNPLRQDDRHREILHRVLGAHGIQLAANYVQSLIVFAGGEIKSLRLDTADEMRVVADTGIVDYLRARCGDFPPNPGALDAEQVANLLSTLRSMNYADDPKVVSLHADNVAAASRRFVRRPARNPLARSRPAPAPSYGAAQIYRSTERYPDGSPPPMRSARSIEFAARALVVVAVLAAGWWFLVGGGTTFLTGHSAAISRLFWMSAPSPNSPPTQVVSQQAVAFDAPLALRRLKEADPQTYKLLANPMDPLLSTRHGWPTYTWQYVTKTSANSVSERWIAITLNENGEIVGATDGP